MSNIARLSSILIHCITYIVCTGKDERSIYLVNFFKGTTWYFPAYCILAKYGKLDFIEMGWPKSG